MKDPRAELHALMDEVHRTAYEKGRRDGIVSGTGHGVASERAAAVLYLQDNWSAMEEAIDFISRGQHVPRPGHNDDADGCCGLCPEHDRPRFECPPACWKLSPGGRASIVPHKAPPSAELEFREIVRLRDELAACPKETK